MPYGVTSPQFVLSGHFAQILKAVVLQLIFFLINV